MKQYDFEGDRLILRVKKSPILLRLFLYLLTVVSFIMPLTGVTIVLFSGEESNLGSIFVFVLFGLIGFYLLRVSLWNSIGKEEIQIEEHQLSYVANYGWFKDSRKYLNMDQLTVEIQHLGDSKSDIGILLLSDGESKIECATRMSAQELNEVSEFLKKRIKHAD